MIINSKGGGGDLDKILEKMRELAQLVKEKDEEIQFGFSFGNQGSTELHLSRAIHVLGTLMDEESQLIEDQEAMHEISEAYEKLDNIKFELED